MINSGIMQKIKHYQITLKKMYKNSKKKFKNI